MAARAVLLAIAILLGGCAGALRDYDEGPHALRVSSVVIHDPVQDRDIPLRVSAPQEPGTYPVVIFSHGAFCYPQKYALVLDHWASYGYLVIAPDHLDSANNPTRLGPEQLGRLLDARIRDLSFVTDSVPAIAAQVGMAGTPDTTRMAISGHSFGGMLAQIKGGLLLRDPASGAPVSRADPRYRAAVVMSGVGPMPQMAADAFSGLRLPLIASGGTLDVGNVGSGQIFPWEWRMSPYTLAPPPDKYAVILEKGDHYLGGLICREDRGGEDDLQGVAIVRALQATFLDAYLKDDAAARRFLGRAEIPVLTDGRARFERK